LEKNKQSFPLLFDWDITDAFHRVSSCCTNLATFFPFQIKDMRFIFHVNQDAVRQYIDRNLKPER